MLTFGKLTQSVVKPTRVFTPRRVQNARFASTSFPSYLLNVPQTKVTSLPNNLRVATEETYGETATVGMFIDTGSRYENAQNNGVAHFLEHMAFKGTKNRSRTKLEIEIENMGGTLNAYTSREQTVFYLKVFKNDVPKAVEILSDILTNSTLDNNYIEAERSTILREMEEVGKDHGEVIFDHLHSAAFQGTGLGRTILGPADNVKKIGRDDLLSYIKTHYQAPRMVLAGAGSVKHEDLVSLGNKYFSQVPNGSDSVYNKDAAKFTGAQITVRDDTMDDVHVAISVEGVSWNHPDYFTFMILQQLIGNWDRNIGGGKNLSSNLCEKVAVENLAKSISAFNTCYTDSGLFGVYGVTEPEKAEDLVFEILREFNRLGKNAHPSEVDRAKARLKASLLMSLDGTTSTCEDIGRQLLTYGRRLTPAEVSLRIDSITTKDVMRVAADHCEDVEPAVVAIGPLAHFPDYNQIREWTYWRRW